MDINADARSTAIILSPYFRWIAASTFLLGLLLDTASTITLIQHPEFMETNPIIASVLSLGGPLGMLVVKLGVPGGLLYVFRRYYDGDELTWITNILLVGCGLPWILAGVWNISLLL